MEISWQHNYIRDPKNTAAELCPVEARIFEERAYIEEVGERFGSHRYRRKKEPEVLS